MYLVLAYGNSLRQDDGFAWVAAEQLRSRPLAADVAILTLHQLTPELSEDLSRAEGVVFVDARTDGTPGEIREVDVHAGAEIPTLGHTLAPETLLALSLTLFGRVPRARLITVTGEAFGLGEGLSRVVAGAVDEAVCRIAGIIRSWDAILPPECP